MSVKMLGVKTSESLPFHTSNEKLAKMVRINVFRSLQRNQSCRSSL